MFPDGETHQIQFLDAGNLVIDVAKIFFSSQNNNDDVLRNTIFEKYDTIIFDLDNTIWDCFTPTGTGMGAYATEAPYELQEKNTIVDIRGNVIKLQEGIRECLEILDNNNKNLGIVSTGQKLSDIVSRTPIPTQAQPSIMLLKKFDIYKYFNYDIILKAFANKLEYVRPLGETLFIDDKFDNLTNVQQNSKVDVLWRKSFQTWQQLLLPKRNPNFSWKIPDDRTSEKTDEDGTLRRLNDKGKPHSLYSPAVEYSNGDKYWYQNGERHREDGPAIERDDGSKEWYLWDRFIGCSDMGFTDEDFENYKREHNIITSSKLSWLTLKVGGGEKQVPSTPVGSTQVNIPNDKKQPIIDFINSIPEEELYIGNDDDEYNHYGRELEPHVTVLFGLTQSGAADARRLVKDFGKIRLKLGKMSLFERDKFDVLMVEVESKSLQKLNKLMRDNLQFNNEFPTYKPHLTLAYLKKGKGDKYRGNSEFDGQSFEFSTLLYSDPDRNKIGISLIGDPEKLKLSWKVYEDDFTSEKTDEDGTLRRRNDKGQLHSLYSPAVEYSDGNKFWYQNDKQHRTDGPAVEYTNGGKAWYLNGAKHRTDGPAVEYSDGSKAWYLNDDFIGDSENGFTDEDFENYKREHNIIASSKIIFADPLTYTDISDIDSNFSDRTLLNRVDDVLVMEPLKDGFPGEDEGYLFTPTLKTPQPLDREKSQKISVKLSWRIPDDFTSEKTDEYGTLIRLNDKGQLHSLYSPAEEYANGDKEWYQNGERHREDGPAVEYADGDKEWYQNGERHREGGPAIEYANGDKFWYLNGKCHRTDGPAVEYADGDKEWYQNGKLHREGGPAEEYANGDKFWYLNGKRHREDGPAIEYADGDKEWYLNNNFVGRSDDGFTDEDFENYKREHNITSSKDPGFDYLRDRENQQYQFEPDNTPGLNPLDMQQEYYTDFFLPDLESDEKEIETKDWMGRENLELWAGRTGSFQKRLGRCYELSWQFVMDNPNWNLIHGYITTRDLSKTIDHAWCETGDMVFDPVVNIKWPKDAYYRFFNAEKEKEYSFKDAIQNGSLTGHYGPWHDITRKIGVIKSKFSGYHSSSDYPGEFHTSVLFT